MKLAKVSILVGLALCAILVFSTSILADLEDMCRFENRLNVSPAPQPEAVKSAKGTYQGHVRLYIVEKFAMRYNYSDGSKLTMGYLDMPYNEGFDLEYQETVVDTQIWNGTQTGFSDVLDDNLMVIAAVYNDSTFTQNSTPGYSPAQYYTARHVDATAGADTHRDWPNQRTETFTHSILAEEATEYW